MRTEPSRLDRCIVEQLSPLARCELTDVGRNGRVRANPRFMPPTPSRADATNLADCCRNSAKMSLTLRSDVSVLRYLSV